MKNYLFLIAFLLINQTEVVFGQVNETLGFKMSGMESKGASEFIELKKAIAVDGQQVKVIRLSQGGSVAEFGNLTKEGTFSGATSRSYGLSKSKDVVINLGTKGKSGSEILTLNKDRTVLLKAGENIQVKPMRFIETPLSIRHQVLGFTKYPEGVLLDDLIKIKNQEYQTIRFVKNSSGGTHPFRVYLGGVGFTKAGTPVLVENKEMVLKGFYGRDVGLSGNVVELSKGNYIECNGNQVIFKGKSLNSRAFATYRLGQGYVLKSNFKTPYNMVARDFMSRIQGGKFTSAHKADAPINPKKSHQFGTLRMGAVAILASTFVIMPKYNPYVDIQGLDCDECSKGLSKIRCERDSILNPFNNRINCSEILEYWRLSEDNSICAAKLRYYYFSVDDKKGISFLSQAGFFNGFGTSLLLDLNLEERIEYLKDNLSIDKIETEVQNFPEGAKILK